MINKDKNIFWTITTNVEKTNTYPFLKGPALADFMFIVVEHFLPNLDDLVPHVLNLCHPLRKNTQKELRLEHPFMFHRITFSTRCKNG